MDLKQKKEGLGMTSRRTRNRLVVRLRDQGISDEKVLSVINEIPRHLFVDEALAHRAYEDTALPIGFNQTISQPYVVAKMTEALVCGPPIKKVLEIGTGSGYQTAILAELIITNKRLIAIDKKGLTGKKQKYLSVPLDKIIAYSISTAGNIDLDSDLEIFLSGVGSIRVGILRPTKNVDLLINTLKEIIF